MSYEPTEGHLTTVTFGTSNYEFNVISIDKIGRSVDVIETTHLSTTGGKTYMPADLPDSGQCVLTVDHNQEQDVVVPGVVETISFDVSGLGLTKASSGFIVGYEVNTIETGQKVTAALTVQFTGEMTQATS
ncbi:hypothetical protein M0R72_13730 [Candidatus Pacearchaeota archaeon]|jgi:hypothetical protein|nr:hypothetical protein [Candidatus Pacearchaeota archaeon]